MLVPNITLDEVIDISVNNNLIKENEIIYGSEAYTLYCGEEITEDMLGVNEFEELGLMDSDPMNVILFEVKDGNESLFISALYQVENNDIAVLYSLVKQNEDMEIIEVINVY